MTTDNFEVQNDAIRVTMEDIARRIGAAMPTGWGFVLMLTQYGEGGSTFYASSAERDDIVAMLKDWIARQGEIDVIDPTLSLVGQMRGNWHRIAAILLQKFAAGEVLITHEDIKRIGRDAYSVAAREDTDGLRLSIVTAAEGQRLKTAGLTTEA